MKRSTFGWALFAVLGVALAAGVSIAAGQLSSQRIGLSSEPITAGKRLVPATPRVRHRPHRPKRHRPKGSRPRAAAPPAPQALTTPAPSAPAPQPAPATPAPAPKRTATSPRRSDDSRPEREARHGGDD